MIDPKRLAGGFRLGEWTVKPDDGSLKSAGKSSRLEPLLMDLLVFLCSRAGEVVPKDQVLDVVWGGRFVSDDTIKASFYQLRKALGDDSREPRFLETLPKRGYRVLILPVPIDAEPDLLAKGRAALESEVNPAALKQARLYFEKLLESDPDHAAALAGLARTFIAMASLGFPGDLWIHARTAALRAIELDPKLAEAHLASAAVTAMKDHDPEAGLRELDRAVELDSRDAVALRWRGRLRSALGRHEEAIEDARRAAEMDPLSVPARRDLLEILFIARRYDEVAVEARRLFEIAPAAADIHLGMVWVHAVQHRDREAFDEFIAGLEALAVPHAQVDQARDAFALGGLPEILRLWAALLETQASVGLKTQNDLLVLYALAGDADRSFRIIEASFELGNPFVLALAESPAFDKLRGDPRFAQWIKRLGLIDRRA